MMNGAKYATFNIDALDFDYGASSAAPADDPLYHGPQDEGYDPSAAAPQPSLTLGSYNSTGASASGVQVETQQQQQQAYLLGTMNDYQPVLTTYNMGVSAPTPSSVYGHHPATASANPGPHYQQHNAAATTNTNSSVFDPLPITMNHIPMSQGSSSNPFEDFLLSTQTGASTGGVDPVLGDNGTYSNTVSSAQNEPPYGNEPWLNDIKIQVSTLSLEPLSGTEILTRLQIRMDDVITKYLPCVDFLVQCQQDLRKGLVVAQRKVGSSRRYYQQQMTPRQFWTSYVEPLPRKFMMKNQNIMDTASLNEAVTALEMLRKDAKGNCESTCEAVKNSFLGGMKEGESWGLRKWLSRHGNALAVCTDLECILKALKALDKSLDSTNKLAGLLRPIANRTLTRLKKDVPSSYQERSSAHPYLPFFHRLEGALRDMGQFDPNDDGVICLDDSDDDSDVVVEVKQAPRFVTAKPSTSRAKRKVRETKITNTATPKESIANHGFTAEGGTDSGIIDNSNKKDDNGSSSGSDEECDVVEVVGVKQPVPEPAGSPASEWKCKTCSGIHPSSFLVCDMCGTENDNDNNAVLFQEIDKLFTNNSDGFQEDDVVDPPPLEPPGKKKRRKNAKASKKSEEIITSHLWPTPVSFEEIHAAAEVALRIAAKLDTLAQYFREHREAEVRPMTAPRGAFWNAERYADALSIFGSILRSSESAHFVERVSEDRLMIAKPERSRYTHIIKNPLCFTDVAAALIADPLSEEETNCYGDGQLPGRSLASWNMWKGIDLLQALDLVLLNSLAYGKITGEGRSRHRARTNELRKFLWARIQEVVANHVSADDSERKRQYTPTRRSESSGFVVFKYKE